MNRILVKIGVRTELGEPTGSSGDQISVCNIDDETHTLNGLEPDLYLLRP